MEGVYAPLVAGVALGLLCLAVVIRHPGKAIKLPELSQSDIESDSECSSDDDAVNDDSVSSDKTVAAALSPIPPAAGASNLRRRRNGGNNKSGSSRAGPETVMMPHTASISAGQQDAVAGLQHQPDQASGNPTSELQRAFFNTDDPAVVRKMYQVAKRKADKQVTLILFVFEHLANYFWTCAFHINCCTGTERTCSMVRATHFVQCDPDCCVLSYPL